MRVFKYLNFIFLISTNDNHNHANEMSIFYIYKYLALLSSPLSQVNFFSIEFLYFNLLRLGRRPKSCWFEKTLRDYIFFATRHTKYF